ncbi:unnamed protein product [Echinostoma caproni]|uniref:SAM domain-containing protein n=1 Tax=Echinostoma caproni TaxID=27848 RepID=A0A183A9G2_9TREM|nr:unnamed protein product [Echinostoma caproni]
MAQAIHDFHDPCTPNALSFHKGDLLSIFCNTTTPVVDRHGTYRGFLTAHGPQPVGLVPGWAITFVPSSKPSPLISPLPRTKVDFAVQTDFPDDVVDEYFSDTDDSCSSEAEADSGTNHGGGRSVELVQAAPPRTHIMSSSVELKMPTRHSGPGSPTGPRPTGMKMMTMQTTATTATGMSQTTKMNKSNLNGSSTECSSDGTVLHIGNPTAQTMTPAWVSTKRHSAASLDSGRDSTYAASSEGSGGTHSTHPSSGGMLRSPQPSLDRAPMSRLDAAHQEQNVTVMHCSYPGTAYNTRNNTLVTPRTPMGNVTNPPVGESAINYAPTEGTLSISSADSLSEGSSRFVFPYSCSSLPSAAASIQPINMPTNPHRPMMGTITGRSIMPEQHTYSHFVPTSPGVSSGDFRSPHPVFHSPHPVGHTRGMAYRPVEHFERRREISHDPLAQWLYSIGLSRLEETLSSAGFDLWTLCRTTPEELNACGVTNPADRQVLRMELNRLQLPDLIPDQLPVKVYDWLAQLNLAAYWPFFREQKLCTFEQIAKLTWEDLEEVGISKLGHQKKLLLAINRLTRQIATANNNLNRIPSPYVPTSMDNVGGYSIHSSNVPGYSSSFGSSASISSPTGIHNTDSLSSLVPPIVPTAENSNPTGCLSICPPLTLEELQETENLGESPPFPSPPPAFQDPVPLPLPPEEDAIPQTFTPVQNTEVQTTVCDAQKTTTRTTKTVTTTNLPPPVPLRRSSMTEEVVDIDPIGSSTQMPWSGQQSNKNSLRFRFPRMARRVHSIVSSHMQDSVQPGTNLEDPHNLTRRSSSPSLFPLKSDALVAKEQLTKWASGKSKTNSYWCQRERERSDHSV